MAQIEKQKIESFLFQSSDGTKSIFVEVENVSVSYLWLVEAVMQIELKAFTDRTNCEHQELT